MLNKRSTCRNCIHFLVGVNGASRAPAELERKDGVGLCRRHPPHWIPDAHSEDEGGLYAFPAIHQDHRCGDWSDGSEWNSPC